MHIRGLLLAGVLATSAAGEIDDRPKRLTVEIWVHLLTSEDSRAVHCEMSDQAVLDLVASANTYWEQAGIRWQVGKLRRTSARDSRGLDALVYGDYPTAKSRKKALKRTQRLHARMLPTRGWQPNGVDVVIVHDMGELGGGYYSSGRIVFGANGLVHGPGTHGRMPPVVLAHELGHALGLAHAPCEQEDNFMLGRCASRDGSEDALTGAQIENARRAAVRLIARRSSSGER